MNFKKKLGIFAAASALIVAVAWAAQPFVIQQDDILLGRPFNTTKTFYFNKNAGPFNPAVRYSQSSGKIEVSFDGLNFKVINKGTDIDSTGASNGALLTANGSGGSIWQQPVGLPPSTIISGFWLSAPDGWLFLDGNSIGNAGSGATSRANADTQALFEMLWNGVSNTNLPIQDSTGAASTRGASATADFNANKRMPLPNGIDLFLRGAGTGRTIGGVAYPTITLGQTYNDAFQGHGHNTNYHYTHADQGNSLHNYRTTDGATGAASTDGVTNIGYGNPRYGTETVPVHLGVNYLIKL